MDLLNKQSLYIGKRNILIGYVFTYISCLKLCYKIFVHTTLLPVNKDVFIKYNCSLFFLGIKVETLDTHGRRFSCMLKLIINVR